MRIQATNVSLDRSRRRDWAASSNVCRSHRSVVASRAAMARAGRRAEGSCSRATALAFQAARPSSSKFVTALSESPPDTTQRPRPLTWSQSAYQCRSAASTRTRDCSCILDLLVAVRSACAPRSDENGPSHRSNAKRSAMADASSIGKLKPLYDRCCACRLPSSPVANAIQVSLTNSHAAS